MTLAPVAVITVVVSTQARGDAAVDFAVMVSPDLKADLHCPGEPAEKNLPVKS